MPHFTDLYASLERCRKHTSYKSAGKLSLIVGLEHNVQEICFLEIFPWNVFLVQNLNCMSSLWTCFLTHTSKNLKLFFVVYVCNVWGNVIFLELLPQVQVKFGIDKECWHRTIWYTLEWQGYVRVTRPVQLMRPGIDLSKHWRIFKKQNTIAASCSGRGMCVWNVSFQLGPPSVYLGRHWHHSHDKCSLPALLPPFLILWATVEMKRVLCNGWLCITLDLS